MQHFRYGLAAGGLGLLIALAVMRATGRIALL